jgi:hypothetical protein
MKILSISSALLIWQLSALKDPTGKAFSLGGWATEHGSAHRSANVH